MARDKAKYTQAREKLQKQRRMREREAEQANQSDNKELGVRKARGPARGRTAVAISNHPTLLREIEFVMQATLAGHDPRSIARASEEALGYPITATRVKTTVQRELNKRIDPIVKNIRLIEDRRLDHYLTKLEPAVERGDVQAIHEARAISETRRKMWGADMPANVRITGDIEHHLDPAVEALFLAAKERQAQREANDRLAIEATRIIDAEVVAETADPDFREADTLYQEPESDYVDPGDDFEIEDLA